LNTCPHMVGSQVLSFDEEAKELQSWRNFVEEADPDAVVGYNISRCVEVRASTACCVIMAVRSSTPWVTETCFTRDWAARSCRQSDVEAPSARLLRHEAEAAHK
ncbi:hypothetical protein BJ138DRAFT_1166690, partial [Hygrophoropsis aurantiaca]